MAMFGKGKQSEPADLLNADVVHELQSAAKKKFTGVLEVTDVATKQVASLYLFEGGLYAVSIPGYLPSIPDRLRVSGTITGDQAKLLTVPGSDWPSPLAGPVAVEQNWLTADALASLHQEYLVASLGAVAALGKVKVKARKGESTKDFCTLPVPVDPLFDTLRMRAGRLAAGWGAITAEGTPATVALESRHVAPPSDMTLPEFTALVDAVDGHSSIDAVAYGLGLTRAEAVHMSMLLVRAGVLHVAAQPAVPARTDRLLVPEAFGQVVPQAPAASAAPEPEPVPEAVAVTEVAAAAVAAEAVAPEPDPVVSGSPLLATSAVFAAGQAFGQPAPTEPAAPDVAPGGGATAGPAAGLVADPLPVAPEVAPAFESAEPVSSDGVEVGDSSAPGWAAALLAAEAVSHARTDAPATEEFASVPAWDAPTEVTPVVPEAPVQPWAAATPTGALAMPEPEPAPPVVEPAPALDVPPAVPVVAAAAFLAADREPAPADASPAEPSAMPAEPSAMPAQPSATPPAVSQPDEHVLLLRRELAISEVGELEQLLAKVTAEETDAITRASSVRARLTSAKEAVARIDADLGRSPQS